MSYKQLRKRNVTWKDGVKYTLAFSVRGGDEFNKRNPVLTYHRDVEKNR